MRTLSSGIVFLLFFFFAGTLKAQPPRGIHWSKDGTGYFAVEDGNIVLTQLPGFIKTTIVAKNQLIPVGAAAPLSVRNFFFSPDNRQVMIYTNTQKVWRYDTRGDYWLLDLNSKQFKQLGKGRAASSLMFAKFSPDGKKVAYVSEYNIYMRKI